MKYVFGTMFAMSIFAAIGACGGPVIVPGPPRNVVKSAAAAWSSAGHACALKGDLAYCDVSSTLPLIIGVGASGELLFVTVFETQSTFGKPCEAVPFDRVMRPEWMGVKCDEIALADATKRTVLSIVGGGGLPRRGMSSDELVRSATLFLEEAEAFLLRLKDFLALPR
jgi:hypothetical protein